MSTVLSQYDSTAGMRLISGLGKHVCRVN